MTTERIDAILSLKPKAAFTLNNDVITWFDKVQTEPTKSEIDAEIIRLDKKYDDEKYKRDRKKEYPSVVDQLDLIYHSGIDAWKTKIKETKDKYPK